MEKYQNEYILFYLLWAIAMEKTHWTNNIFFLMTIK